MFCIQFSLDNLDSLKDIEMFISLENILKPTVIELNVESEKTVLYLHFSLNGILVQMSCLSQDKVNML